MNPMTYPGFSARAVLFSLLALTALVTVPAQAGTPEDWSNRHVLYHPDTQEAAARNGTLAQWNKNSRDPRFTLQLVKKLNAQKAAGAAAPQAGKKPVLQPVHRDWSHVMGGASGVGKAGVFPAKYGFQAATADCANDFVVYTTASSGATGAGTVFASRSATFTANGTNNKDVVIENPNYAPKISVTVTSSTTSNTGTFFQLGGSGNSVTDAATSATNLVAAIARNGAPIGVTANFSGTATVTVSATTVGTDGNAIKITEGVGNISLQGNLAGGANTPGQATIIAFNNVYSSCNTSTRIGPKTFWSYNTGAAAFTETSPVLSLDGTQVAFVQRTGTAASLVLLKWSSTTSVGTIGAPTAPTSETLASYRGCSAPCMTVISLGANNTISSPFYVYGDDVLFVGDDSGKLHRFTGVFGGTPAETVVNWPVTVNTGKKLSSPVYDANTGLVFVGSSWSGTSGGLLHSVNSAGTVNDSGQLGGNRTGQANEANTGVADAPMVDSFAQKVYALVGTDATSNCDNKNCNAIYQFSTTSPLSGQTLSKVSVGKGDDAGVVLYSGVFDEAYYGGSGGFMYVCGGQPTGGDGASTPTLWRVPISAGNVMGTPVEGPKLAGAHRDCSPVTVVMNGTTEYLFVSVDDAGSAANAPGTPNCDHSCIYMYTLTGLTWATSAKTTSGLTAPGGTGGIIIDNFSSTTGASQVYYATRTNPGLAIQASQAGLN